MSNTQTRNTPVSQVMSSAGLTIDSGAKTFDTGAFNYVIDGIFYAQAAAANTTAPLTDAYGRDFRAIKEDHQCYFMFHVDESGDYTVTQGDSKPIEDPLWQFPDYPALGDEDTVAFGLALIENTATADWNFGDDNFPVAARISVWNLSTPTSRRVV